MERHVAMLTARGEPWYSTHVCDARTWHHRRVQLNADVSAAGPLPDALVLINTGLRGRSLAVKHGVNRDVMIARGVCTVWGNALKQSPPSGSASGTSSGQAFEDDFDTDVVVLGRFLLQRLAASRDSGSFAEWPSGPRHWLGLPGTKSVLRSRLCRPKLVVCGGPKNVKTQRKTLAQNILCSKTLVCGALADKVTLPRCAKDV